METMNRVKLFADSWHSAWPRAGSTEIAPELENGEPLTCASLPFDSTSSDVMVAAVLVADKQPLVIGAEYAHIGIRAGTR